MTKIQDVIVVGAGFSGLMCCKHALENDLSVLVFEKQEDLGGIWNYSPDPDRSSVYKSTITTWSLLCFESHVQKNVTIHFIHRSTPVSITPRG